MDYLLLKYIHILSATILFGTGIGTAFFMWMAYLSRNNTTLALTTKHVILADWFFTTPSVILQPVTGFWLMLTLHYPFNSLWFALTMGLYVLAGVCWVIVVFIQYKLHQMAKSIAQSNAVMPERYHNLMYWWFSLGVIAFGSIMVIYWLMISKAGLQTQVIKIP